MQPRTRTAWRFTFFATPPVCIPYGPRHVRAVAIAVVAVLAVADGIEGDRHPSTKLDVRLPNAGVEDIGMHSGAGLVVHVSLVQREKSLVDSIKTPGGIRLRGIPLKYPALLHVLDPEIAAKGLRIRL